MSITVYVTFPICRSTARNFWTVLTNFSKRLIFSAGTRGPEFDVGALRRRVTDDDDDT